MSNQKPRTIEEQIRLLCSRGMKFSSEEYAKDAIEIIEVALRAKNIRDR